MVDPNLHSSISVPLVNICSFSRYHSDIFISNLLILTKKPKTLGFSVYFLGSTSVPEVGIEPTSQRDTILSRACIPVPPLGHYQTFNLLVNIILQCITIFTKEATARIELAHRSFADF